MFVARQIAQLIRQTYAAEVLATPAGKMAAVCECVLPLRAIFHLCARGVIVWSLHLSTETSLGTLPEWVSLQ